MTEHRGGAGESAREVADYERRYERRRKALGYVEEDNRDPVAPAEGAQDIRGSDVAAADRPDVQPFRPSDPVPEREAAGEVADDDESERFDKRYFRGIAYFDTQSFTVPQSRLSKNASM